MEVSKEEYSKSPTYEWALFWEHICKSNQVSLGTQLTQLAIQVYNTVHTNNIKNKK